MSKKKAVVLLADGFEEVEALTQIDYLRRAGIEVSVLGVAGKRVTSAHNLVVEADMLLSEYSGEPDAVVLPGGMPGAANIAASEAAMKLTLKQYKQEKLVAAICAAPAVVLYPLGIIDGRTATCYPGFEKEWTKAVFSDERVVVDGNVITSRGPGTAGEFAEAIITRLLDSNATAQVHAATLQR